MLADSGTLLLLRQPWEDVHLLAVVSTSLVRWALQPGSPGAGLKGGHGAQGSEVGGVWVGGSSRKLRCEKPCLLPITVEFPGIPFLSPLGPPELGCSVLFPFSHLPSAEVAVSR